VSGDLRVEGASTRLVLTHANVLDPTGSSFIAGAHLVVENGTIIGVGTGEGPAATDGETRIDLGGAHVTPGLIDSHFHLISRSASEVDDELVALGTIEGFVNASERLAAGVTAVRDCGCRHRGIHSLTRAIESGLVPGPRVHVSGANPTGPLAPAHWRNVVAHDADELRAQIRKQVEGGADWVKLILAHAENPTDWSTVTRYLSDEEIAAGVDEAHRLGVRIGCHCEGWDVAAIAVRAGLDALEHAPLVSGPVADEMAARGTVYVPTVWAFSSDAGVDLNALSEVETKSLLHWQDEHRASVARAHAAGVVIAAGSDAEGSLPERDVLVNEMRMLAECGLSPAQVLAAATRAGAGLIGHEHDLGVIKPGSLADVIALRANPLHDLGALTDPLLVVARGQLVRDRRDPAAPDDRLPAQARELVVPTPRWLP
jgi:imidazolonepropionase-like amidohydrolase